MTAADTSAEIAAPPRAEFLKLGELYVQEIEPWLAGQEGRRQKARLLRWLIIGGGFAGLGVLGCVAWSQSWSDFWIFVVIVGAMATVAIGNIPLMSLAADVKKQVMGRLAGHFGFAYEPSPAESDIHLFDELGLLPYRSSASFEDGLSGEIKGVPFQMVEAHLAKRSGTGKSRKTVTVFRGLLLSFPSGQPTTERCLLCPANAEHQIDDDELPAVGTGDPELDLTHRLHAGDAASARRLFDGRARRAVQKLAGRDDVEDLRLGFVDGDLIIAVKRKSDSFEVTRLGQPLADPGRVQAMVEQFAILFDVVDEFGLQPPAASEKPADA